MRRLLVWLLAAGAFGAITGSLVLAYTIEKEDVAPRRLASYLERRAEGHAALPFDLVRWAAARVVENDRGSTLPTAPPAFSRIGAPADDPLSRKATDWVTTEAEFRSALDAAEPGDVITVAPGSYRFEGRAIELTRGGRPEAPITVRADRPGSVRLEFDLLEGFRVAAPFWHFENLVIHGRCQQHDDCEHAFHVVGGAVGFVARHNTLVDFNAHFKINGEGGRFPDRGLIERNTLSNSAARRTERPVTPIDIVAADAWVVRGNLISDFVRASGGASYGGFAKGGGRGNRFEGNVVLCEQKVRGAPGARVGLSLGGGLTGLPGCRDGRCLVEQDGGAIVGNVIASCSDVGIDLNRAANSQLLHNTLLDTAGIQLRDGATGADVEGNLVDGPLTSRDGAALHTRDNRFTQTLRLRAGQHPVRDLFADAAALDLRWRAEPPRAAASAPSPDLCGNPRPAAPALGAFENFAACSAVPAR